MYDKLFTDMKEHMKPALEMLEINGGAVEKLVKQQAEFINSVVKASIAHSKALSQTADFDAVADLQKTYFTDFSQKMMEAAKLNLDVMVDAKDAVSKVVETSFKGVQSKVVKTPAAPATAAAKKAA